MQKNKFLVKTAIFDWQLLCNMCYDCVPSFHSFAINRKRKKVHPIRRYLIVRSQLQGEVLFIDIDDNRQFNILHLSYHETFILKYTKTFLTDKSLYFPWNKLISKNVERIMNKTSHASRSFAQSMHASLQNFKCFTTNLSDSVYEHWEVVFSNQIGGCRG